MGSPSCCRRGPLHHPGGVTVTWSEALSRHLVLWTTPSGARRQQRLRLHDDATAAAREVSTQLLAARNAPAATAVQVAGERVPQLARRWIATAARQRGWTASYVRKQEGIITRWVSPHLDVPATSWTPLATEQLMATVAEVAGASQQRSVLVLLRQLGQWAATHGLVPGDPVAGVRTPPPPSRGSSPTSGQVDNVLAVLDAGAVGPWSASLAFQVRLTAWGGLRKGETLALEANDVNVDAGTVAVERQVDDRHTASGVAWEGYWTTSYGCVSLPKGGRTRTTLLAPQAAASVPGSGLLLPSAAGTYISSNSARERAWRDARMKAGWPTDTRGRLRWSWHALRHHAATWMLAELTLPIADVTAMLGHSDAAVTMRIYAHAREDPAATAAERARRWMANTR